MGEGFEPPKAEPAELQSDPFGRLGNPPGAFHTKVIPVFVESAQSRGGRHPAGNASYDDYFHNSFTLRKGHERFFKRRATFAVRWLGGAIRHSRCDDGESGATQCGARRRKLVQYFVTVATLIDHPHDSANLTLNTGESIARRL